MDKLKIMLCTINTDLVYRMANFVSQLYSDAEYHIVSVIRQLHTRFMLTKLYRQKLYETLEKSQDNVEYILKEHGVKNITRSILYGTPSKELLKYAVKNNIDLVSITPAAKHEVDKIGSTTREVISRINIPILLYTPYSDHIIINEIKIGIMEGINPNKYKVLTVLENNYKIIYRELNEEELSSIVKDELRIVKYDMIIIPKKYYIENKLYRNIWSPALLL